MSDSVIVAVLGVLPTRLATGTLNLSDADMVSDRRERRDALELLRIRARGHDVLVACAVGVCSVCGAHRKQNTMSRYDSIVDRIGTGGEVPDVFAKDVLSDLEGRSSTAMKLGHVIRTDTRSTKIPILAQNVDAWYVGGDQGLKGVSSPSWEMQDCIVEEVATIVPIPDNVASDASFSIWEGVRAEITNAFAKKIDRSILFNVDKPATWSPALVTAATTASQVVTATADPAEDLLRAAELVANQELDPTHAAVRNGWEFGLGASRTRVETVHGSPLDDSTRAFPLSVASMPIVTRPAAWDRTKAEAIVADWSKVVVGVRSDITFTMSNSGVIVDDDGKVVMSAWQQDVTMMRAVLRLGYVLKRPAIDNVRVNPVAIVKPAA